MNRRGPHFRPLNDVPGMERRYVGRLFYFCPHCKRGKIFTLAYDRIADYMAHLAECRFNPHLMGLAKA